MAENEPKKETVRITLPARPSVGETSATMPVKKETVRINLPSRPSLGSAPTAGNDAPKKESAKLSNLAKPPVLTPKPMVPLPPGAVPSSSASAVPVVPRPGGPLAPPRPPGAPGTPMAPRPPAPIGGPPRAPVAPGAPRPPVGAPGANITRPLAPAPRPSVPGATPLAPSAPVSPSASTAETVTPEMVTPATVTPAAIVPAAKAADVDESAATVVAPTPKKDTVRIEVPKAKSLPPQATVRLQQTQPLLRPPAAQVSTLAVTTAAVESVGEDPMVQYVSWGVLVFSVLVLLFQVLNYLALSST